MSAHVTDARLEEAVTSIEAAVRDGSGARTLDALLSAWRIRRLPAFTDAIFALSARYDAALPPISGKTERHRYEQLLDLVAARRSIDIGRIVAEFPHASILRAKDHVERVSVMEPDPRIARAMFDHVANRRYNPFHKIWTAIFRELRRHGDERTREALAELLPTDPEASMPLRSRVQYAVDHIPSVEPPSDALAARLDAILAAIAGLRLDEPRATAPQPNARDESALFAQLIASPHDDDIRLVLADVYAERGDIRAEFIQLQIANARAEKPLVKNVQRVEKILKKHLVELLGPIEPVVDKSTVQFERGFLVHAAVATKTPAQRALLDHPLLSTLTSVVTNDPEVVRRLRAPRVSGLAWTTFVEIAHGRVPATHTRALSVTLATASTPLKRMNGFPALEELRIEAFHRPHVPDPFACVLDAPFGARTVDLVVGYRRGRLTDLLQALDARPSLARLRLHPRAYSGSNEDLCIDIARAPRGYAIELRGDSYDSAALAEVFQGFAREDVTIAVHAPPAACLAWLDAHRDARFVDHAARNPPSTASGDPVT